MLIEWVERDFIAKAPNLRVCAFLLAQDYVTSSSDTNQQLYAHEVPNNVPLLGTSFLRDEQHRHQPQPQP
jgi:hypothetical protein